MFLCTCCLEKYLTNVMGWLAAVSQVPQPSLSHCLLPVSNGGAGALPLDNKALNWIFFGHSIILVMKKKMW